MTTALFISSASCDKKSALGSTVTIDLKTPIKAYNKKVRVLSANVWYNFPNISTELNNRIFSFGYNGAVYEKSFEPGLYSLGDIQESIVEYCENEGLPTNLILLSGDEATGLISMKITSPLLFVTNFDVNNNLFKEYLGFRGVVIIAGSLWVESEYRAKLNINNTLYINCSFASGAYFNQNSGSNIIGAIPLNKSPGSLIYQEWAHPVVTHCLGADINNFNIWLTNENGKLLDMNGEDWNIVIEIYD